MDAKLRDKLSAAACARLVMLPAFEQADILLAYMAMPHECSPADAVEFAWRAGKKVAFPVCEENFALGLYLPSGADSFIRGKYGIMEPDPRRCARIAGEQIDCVIVPGLAFDAQGQRLGQGAGYYDRLLQKSGAYRIGLCFPHQLVSAVPADAHDCAMDAVVDAEHFIFTKDTERKHKPS